MHPKFLKFLALVILIIGSFFIGKHLIINAQNSPTLTVSATTVQVGQSTNVSWTSIDQSSLEDWIGLFSSSAADGAGGNNSILYARPKPSGGPCPIVLGESADRGNCNFPIFTNPPVNINPGTYNLRYFHKVGNTWNKIATSNNFNIIASSSGSGNSVKVTCTASPSSLCGGVTARVYVPQGGCPSGDEDCGKNNYKQDKPIPSGSTTVTLTDIPDGVYTVILIKDGYVTTPPKIEVSLGGGTTSTATFTLSLDTSKINSFKATPSPIDKGNSSTLSWTTQDFTPNTCSINNGVGSIPNNGQKTVSPTVTTTYILSCYNSAGIRKTATATVTVKGVGGGGGADNPSLSVGVSTVQAGGTINVSWANIPNPSTKDYVFISPHATENDYNWDYLNDSPSVGSCLNNPPVNPTVSGTCSFTVASAATPGTYTFKYAKYESGTTWNTSFLTSNSFTITSNAGGGGGGTGTGGGGGTGGTGGGASCNANNVLLNKIPYVNDKYHAGFNTLIGVAGSGMNRRYVVSKSYGFLTYNLADLNNPVFHFETNSLIESGGRPFHADAGSSHGGSMFSGMAISKDGTRLLAQDDDYYGMYVYRNDSNVWSPSMVGTTEMRAITGQIVKRTDGKYLALVDQLGWLKVMDISDDKIANTILKDPREDNPSVLSNYYNLFEVASSQGFENESVTLPNNISYRLFASGNYVLDRPGDYIRIFDVSKPLGNPDISSNITLQKLKLSDFGVDSSKYQFGNFTVTGSTDGNPAHIYVFARFYEKGSYGYELSQKGGVVELLNGVVKKTWSLSFPAEYSGAGAQEIPLEQNKAYVSAIGPRAFFILRGGDNRNPTFINFTINESTKNLTSGIVKVKGDGVNFAGAGGYDVIEENNTVYIYMADSSTSYWAKAPCTTVTDASPSVKIDSFTASPPIIKNGESSKLTWQTTSTFPANVGRNYVTLNGEPVGEDGERTVEPNRTTNYTLKISRSEDSGAASADSCTAKAERFDDSSNRPRIFAAGYLNYLSLYGNAIKKLMIGQNFGYTTASLVNPSSPIVAGHDNMITAGGGGPIEKVGDGQSTVMEVATSPDGQRALVGWTDAESGSVFVLSPDGEIFKTVDQFGSYRPTGLGIVQRSDGKYFGFDLGHNYLFVKDITSPPGDGSYPLRTDSESIIHPTRELNNNARTSGHFFGYKIDDESLGIVYAGAPYSGGNITNILKTFKVTSKDLGASAYTINNFTLVSTPNNPDVAYIFADLRDGLKGGPVAVATINSSGVVTPLAGSPFIVPAPFTAGQLEHKSTIGFYNGSEPQATIIRGTVDSWGFINIKASSNNLSISVATLPKADFNSSRDIAGWGNGKNTYIYTAQSTKVSAVTITCNNTGGPTPPSGTCTAPNCVSAMRVVTVSNDGGGGTGTGGDDDGTGRRSWFWWLKYYLNL